MLSTNLTSYWKLFKLLNNRLAIIQFSALAFWAYTINITYLSFHPHIVSFTQYTYFWDFFFDVYIFLKNCTLLSCFCTFSLLGFLTPNQYKTLRFPVRLSGFRLTNAHSFLSVSSLYLCITIAVTISDITSFTNFSIFFCILASQIGKSYTNLI